MILHKQKHVLIFFINILFQNISKCKYSITVSFYRTLSLNHIITYI